MNEFFLSFNNVVSHYSSSFYINYLSLALVIFSITFLWWLNFNILNIPSLFLYIDFFVPLFYVFLILLLSFISLKFLLNELTYNFLVNYLANFSVLNLKNLNFIDLFLNSLNSNGFTIFMFSSLWSNNYMNSLNFNSVVILLFFIFIII